MAKRTANHQTVSGKQYFDSDVQLGGNTGSSLGSGFTAGYYHSWVETFGNVAKYSIMIDLTGAHSTDTLNDIIGTEDTANAHIGQVPDEAGTIFAARWTCLEAPAGGEVDIDLNSATEGTLAEDSLITAGTETVLFARAGDWAIQDVKTAFAALPGVGQYLYLSVGTNSSPTAGDYSAGQFLIEFWGAV